MVSSTCASADPSEQEQEQEQPFTFASPVSSETCYEDHAVLRFDYESWIQQSKIANCPWKMEDTESSEAIQRCHREMMLRAVDNLPEEAYELSLRDLTDLSLPPARATATTRTPPPTTTTKPTPSPAMRMQGAAGFIITNLFMASPSRHAAAAGRKKSFFSSSNSTVSVLRKKSTSSADDHGRRSISMDNNDTRSGNDGMPSNDYHDSTERKSVSCYPFFSSSKYKEKRAASGHFCL